MGRRVVALIAAAGAALPACDAGSSAPRTASAASTTAGAPTTAAAPTPVPAGSAAPVTGTYAPAIDPAAFVPAVDNPYFPLRPGARWEYRSRSADGVESTVVTVTSRTRSILGVRCVEVRDTVTVDGQFKEDTLDWYAEHRDGTVWYFGEDTKEYDNGKVSTTEGSWTAGVDGALPGIAMPARPQPGERYRQEYYRGHAEDMGRVLGLTDAVRVPTGGYSGTLRTEETTPLQPEVLEDKYYARGVGLVLTVDIAGGGVRDELVRFRG